MMQRKTRNGLPFLLALVGMSFSACVRVHQAPTVSADSAQAEPENPETQPQGEAASPVVGESMAAPLPEGGEASPDQPSPGEGAPQPGSDNPPVEQISPPICKMDGTRSEGWYRGNELLIHASCKGVTPECKMSGTRSEGWYAGGELIEYDQCDGKLPE